LKSQSTGQTYDKNFKQMMTVDKKYAID
jgi:hypothetical protein